jgi:DUF1365 family protein
VTLQSAIYVGRVRHRRRAPGHAFTFPLFMVYLDLSELDKVFSMTRLWGRSRFCPARFRREDYLTHAGMGLDESVRACVEERLGSRPTGPIRMLTHLRYFGYIFNPVTFYYCFDEVGQTSAIVAEITNTPWGERHRYVLDPSTARESASGSLRWRFDKVFHVSPFFPMDMENDWTFTPPGQGLFVHMNLSKGGTHAFDATLVMQRREITPGLLRRLLVRFPLMTVQVIAKIHFEALKLWLKRAPVFPHPRTATPDAHPLPLQRSHR